MSKYNSQHYQEHRSEYNDRRKRYRQKNIKQFNLELQNEWYEILKAYCEANKIPITTFIKNACEQVAGQNGYTGFEEYHKKKKAGDMSESNETITNIPEPAILYNYLHQ